MSERARLFLDRIATPIGELLLMVDEADRLCATDWGEKETRLRTRYPALQERATKATDALRAYFDGDLAAIDRLPVATGGTEFQQCVWRALRGIRLRHGHDLCCAGAAYRPSHRDSRRWSCQWQ